MWTTRLAELHATYLEAWHNSLECQSWEVRRMHASLVRIEKMLKYFSGR